MSSRGIRRVVITGMGAVSPAGVGVDALWGRVRDGLPCGQLISHFDAEGMKCRIAAECNEFRPEHAGLCIRTDRQFDRSTQFALAAATEAVTRSRLSPPGFYDLQRCGVLLGTAIGGVTVMERTYRRMYQAGNNSFTMSARHTNPDIYRGFLAYSASNEVAKQHNFCGVCTTMATGCTAGADAIGTAFDIIRTDMADVMITGGVDAPLTPVVVASFDVIKALTRRNNEPHLASRPFDRDRDGFLLAEGCGVVVLEEEHAARQRGATILGQVLGYASMSNAYHMTGLPADGMLLADTITAALGCAQLPPDKIDYINAHGSSTQQNDSSETAAFKRAFGTNVYNIPISATKSVLGHALGAASALETVVCICAMLHNTVPPTANYMTPCPDCDLDYVPNEPRRRTLGAVLCNANGFSGIHSALILAHPDF